MSRARRVARAVKHQKHKEERAKRRSTFEPTCSECGEKGRHFIPPSFGDIGFFMCNPPEDIRNHSRDRANLDA